TLGFAVGTPLGFSDAPEPACERRRKGSDCIGSSFLEFTALLTGACFHVFVNHAFVTKCHNVSQFHECRDCGPDTKPRRSQLAAVPTTATAEEGKRLSELFRRSIDGSAVGIPLQKNSLCLRAIRPWASHLRKWPTASGSGACS